MWYLVISKRKVDFDKLLSRLPDHLDWMKQQHQTGNILFSGPTSDKKFGIYVARARSLEEAKQLVDADPLHLDDLRDYELFEWEVHQVLGTGPFDRESIQFLAQSNIE